MPLALRDGLRSGDVWVPGSRRYCDPTAYLLTREKWADQRAEFCRLVGKPADATTALAQLQDELHTALGELEQTLSEGDGPVRLDERGDLVISPLPAEDVPAESVALKAELTEMLPFAPIVSLLIEMDQRTGLLDCFTHAGGKATRSPELKRNLIAVLLAHATNLGLTRMADACGISYDTLAWTAEWYVREETLRAANLALIGYHGRVAADPDSRLRHAVVLGWAAVPHPRKIDHVQGIEQVLRARGALDVHARDRPAHHLRDQDHRRDETRGALCARRDSR